MSHDEFETDDYEVAIWGPGNRHITIPLPLWLGRMAEGDTKGGLGARAAIAEFTTEELRAVYGKELEPSGESLRVRRLPRNY